MAVCTQALLLVKVVFPHDLAVRGHPAHVHLQRTLHLRHFSMSAGRSRCRAVEEGEERDGKTAVLEGGRGSGPPAPSFACPKRSGVAARADSTMATAPRPQGVSVYGLKPMHVNDYNLP